MLMEKLEYRVGRFTLQPFRQLLEDGVPVSLGRKALDLLSVLAKANGSLVTKDELMAAVWPNVIVEENAIQVHITTLRKVLGDDADLLTTVRGLGYRLTPTETEDLPEPSDPLPVPETLSAPAQPATKRRWARRLLWGSLAVVLAIAMIAGAFVMVRYHALSQINRPQVDRLQVDRRSPSAEIPTIAVLAFQPADGSNEAKLFADGLAGSIAGALSHYNVTVVAPTSSLLIGPAQKSKAGPLLGADFIVDGRVLRSKDKLTVSAQISDTRKNILVYSFEMQQETELSTALANQIATRLALALDPRKFSTTLGRKFAADDYVLMARANEALEKWDIVNDMDLTTQLAGRHPDDAELQAVAGVSIVLALSKLPESQRHQSLQTARTYIERAVQLDPQSGQVYFAQNELKPPVDFAAKEALLRKALQANPNLPHAVDRLAVLMMSVGRTDEAVSLFHRSVQLDPLSVLNSAKALHNYVSAGRLSDASQLLDTAKLLWPEHPAFIFAKHNLAEAEGTPTEAAEIEKEIPHLWEMLRVKKEDAELLMRAEKTKDKELIRQAVASCFRDYGQSFEHAHDQACLFTMVRVKAMDDAFHFAERAYPDSRTLYPKDDDRWLTMPPPGIATMALFSHEMGAFRDDPRFWPVAVRAGLVNYWQTTQKWPDFCRNQIANCETMAADAMRNESQGQAATQQ